MTALALEVTGEDGGAEARWQRIRNAHGAGASLRALAAAGLARLAARAPDEHARAAAEHW